MFQFVIDSPNHMNLVV